MARNNYFTDNIFNEVSISTITPSVKTGDEISNIIENMPQAKRVDVIITGGFHTNTVSEILKNHNVSYIVITPNVTDGLKTAEETYYKIAKEQSKMSFQALANLIASLSPVDQKRVLILADPSLASKLGFILDSQESVLSQEQIKQIAETVKMAGVLLSDDGNDIKKQLIQNLKDRLEATPDLAQKTDESLLEYINMDRLSQALEKTEELQKLIEHAIKIKEAKNDTTVNQSLAIIEEIASNIGQIIAVLQNIVAVKKETPAVVFEEKTEPVVRQIENPYVKEMMEFIITDMTGTSFIDTDEVTPAEIEAFKKIVAGKTDSYLKTVEWLENERTAKMLFDGSKASMAGDIEGEILKDKKGFEIFAKIIGYDIDEYYVNYVMHGVNASERFFTVKEVIKILNAEREKVLKMRLIENNMPQAKADYRIIEQFVTDNSSLSMEQLKQKAIEVFGINAGSWDKEYNIYLQEIAGIITELDFPSTELNPEVKKDIEKIAGESATYEEFIKAVGNKYGQKAFGKKRTRKGTFEKGHKEIINGKTYIIGEFGDSDVDGEAFDDMWVSIIDQDSRMVKASKESVKLHISASPENAQEIYDLVRPILDKYNMTFKVSTNSEKLAELNAGNDTQVGKFMTIYLPKGQSFKILADLAMELDAVLSAYPLKNKSPEIKNEIKIGSSGILTVRDDAVKRGISVEQQTRAQQFAEFFNNSKSELTEIWQKNRKSDRKKLTTEEEMDLIGKIEGELKIIGYGWAVEGQNITATMELISPDMLNSGKTVREMAEIVASLLDKQSRPAKKLSVQQQMELTDKIQDELTAMGYDWAFEGQQGLETMELIGPDILNSGKSVKEMAVIVAGKLDGFKRQETPKLSLTGSKIAPFIEVFGTLFNKNFVALHFVDTGKLSMLQKIFYPFGFLINDKNGVLIKEAKEKIIQTEKNQIKAVEMARGVNVIKQATLSGVKFGFITGILLFAVTISSSIIIPALLPVALYLLGHIATTLTFNIASHVRWNILSPNARLELADDDKNKIIGLMTSSVKTLEKSDIEELLDIIQGTSDKKAFVLFKKVVDVAYDSRVKEEAILENLISSFLAVKGSLPEVLRDIKTNAEYVENQINKIIKENEAQIAVWDTGDYNDDYMYIKSYYDAGKKYTSGALLSLKNEINSVLEKTGYETYTYSTAYMGILPFAGNSATNEQLAISDSIGSFKPITLSSLAFEDALLTMAHEMGHHILDKKGFRLDPNEIVTNYRAFHEFYAQNISFLIGSLYGEDVFSLWKFTHIENFISHQYYDTLQSEYLDDKASPYELMRYWVGLIKKVKNNHLETEEVLIILKATVKFLQDSDIKTINDKGKSVLTAEFLSKIDESLGLKGELTNLFKKQLNELFEKSAEAKADSKPVIDQVAERAISEKDKIVALTGIVGYLPNDIKKKMAGTDINSVSDKEKAELIKVLKIQRRTIMSTHYDYFDEILRNGLGITNIESLTEKDFESIDTERIKLLYRIIKNGIHENSFNLKNVEWWVKKAYETNNLSNIDITLLEEKLIALKNSTKNTLFENLNTKDAGLSRRIQGLISAREIQTSNLYLHELLESAVGADKNKVLDTYNKTLLSNIDTMIWMLKNIETVKSVIGDKEYIEKYINGVQEVLLQNSKSGEMESGQLTMTWLSKLLDFLRIKDFEKRQKWINTIENPIIILGVFHPSVMRWFIGHHKGRSEEAVKEGVKEILTQAGLATLDFIPTMGLIKMLTNRITRKALSEAHTVWNKAQISQKNKIPVSDTDYFAQLVQDINFDDLLADVEKAIPFIAQAQKINLKNSIEIFSILSSYTRQITLDDLISLYENGDFVVDENDKQVKETIESIQRKEGRELTPEEIRELIKKIKQFKHETLSSIEELKVLARLYALRTYNEVKAKNDKLSLESWIHICEGHMRGFNQRTNGKDGAKKKVYYTEDEHEYDYAITVDDVQYMEAVQREPDAVIVLDGRDGLNNKQVLYIKYVGGNIYVCDILEDGTVKSFYKLSKGKFLRQDGTIDANKIQSENDIKGVLLTNGKDYNYKNLQSMISAHLNNMPEIFTINENEIKKDGVVIAKKRQGKWIFINGASEFKKIDNVGIFFEYNNKKYFLNASGKNIFELDDAMRFEKYKLHVNNKDYTDAVINETYLRFYFDGTFFLLSERGNVAGEDNKKIMEGAATMFFANTVYDHVPVLKHFSPNRTYEFNKKKNQTYHYFYEIISGRFVINAFINGIKMYAYKLSAGSLYRLKEFRCLRNPDTYIIITVKPYDKNGDTLVIKIDSITGEMFFGDAEEPIDKAGMIRINEMGIRIEPIINGTEIKINAEQNIDSENKFNVQMRKVTIKAKTGTGSEIMTAGEENELTEKLKNELKNHKDAVQLITPELLNSRDSVRRMALIIELELDKKREAEDKILSEKKEELEKELTAMGYEWAFSDVQDDNENADTFALVIPIYELITPELLNSGKSVKEMAKIIADQLDNIKNRKNVTIGDVIREDKNLINFITIITKFALEIVSAENINEELVKQIKENGLNADIKSNLVITDDAKQAENLRRQGFNVVSIRTTSSSKQMKGRKGLIIGEREGKQIRAYLDKENGELIFYSNDSTFDINNIKIENLKSMFKQSQMAGINSKMFKGIKQVIMVENNSTLESVINAMKNAVIDGLSKPPVSINLDFSNRKDVNSESIERITNGETNNGLDSNAIIFNASQLASMDEETVRNLQAKGYEIILVTDKISEAEEMISRLHINGAVIKTNGQITESDLVKIKQISDANVRGNEIIKTQMFIEGLSDEMLASLGDIYEKYSILPVVTADSLYPQTGQKCSVRINEKDSNTAGLFERSNVINVISDKVSTVKKSTGRLADIISDILKPATPKQKFITELKNVKSAPYDTGVAGIKDILKNKNNILFKLITSSRWFEGEDEKTNEEELKKAINMLLTENILDSFTKSRVEKFVKDGKYYEALGCIRGAVERSVESIILSKLKGGGIEIIQDKLKKYAGGLLRDAIIITGIRLLAEGKDIEPLLEDVFIDSNMTAQQYFDSILVRLNGQMTDIVKENEYVINTLSDEKSTAQAIADFKDFNLLMQDQVREKLPVKKLGVASSFAVRSILGAA
ncbi:MAG: hypothetical protein PHR82_04150 [Endomicrobiaceae bacterium]|nr:hypothetical protein [Endomicrobiaceae bacterium]